MRREPTHRLSAPFAVAALVAALAGCATSEVTGSQASAGKNLDHIRHVVVIYAENHSFDNMYGLFPGANGIKNATPEQATQLDHDGTPLKELITFGSNGKPDDRYPRMPNAPFRIDGPPVNRPPTVLVPSPVHNFYHNQEQINGGKNNLFAAMSNVGGWVMGHYDGSQFKMWQWAKEYTLADNFFMGAFGGSYLNHQYLICACAPVHASAPATMRAQLDTRGKLLKQPDSPSANDGAVRIVGNSSGGQVTPDGYSVNTSQPPYQPSGIAPPPDGPNTIASPKGVQPDHFRNGEPVPPQTAITIGDTLSAKGVTWAWYAQAYRQALADGMQPGDQKRKVIYRRGDGSPNFQAHHQPFNYYSRYAPGTAAREEHLRDGEDFLRDIEKGTLPAVSFYKPSGVDNQHPAYTDIMTGDAHISALLDKLKASPQWKDMLVVVTYDENGGYWDHVPPPSGPGWGDRFGPGSRIPTILIGPHVKKGAIDSTPMDTTSIIKFLTRRFGLEPLPGVRAKMGDLTSALN